MNKPPSCRCPTCGQITDKDKLITAELENLLAACNGLGITPDHLGRVTSGEAALLLGCAPKTLADWRQTESGPDYYRGRPAKYLLEAIAEFLVYRRKDTGRAYR
jgi:hypothetical protein